LPVKTHGNESERIENEIPSKMNLKASRSRYNISDKIDFMKKKEDTKKATT
jgi:uncharacterized membrane protein